MNKFSSTIGTVSALLTIGVTVATVYYNIENKKHEDQSQQQQIEQLQRKLNEKPTVVVETPAPAPVVAPEPTAPPAPVLPTPTVVPAPPAVPAVPTVPTLPNGDPK